LSATASVTIGVVNKVEFYRDGTLVATVLNPPYTATDTSVPAGAHTYTAVAYNDEDPNDILLGSVAASVTVSGAVAQQQMYFIQTDHLNTPRMIANQAGTTVWKWDNTEPFGNSMPSDDPDGDSVAFVFDLRFPGQYFDRETNLAYNWMRDYDPAIGRYLESDPIGLKGGLNTYAYVRLDPLGRVDPTGLDTPGGGGGGEGSQSYCKLIGQVPIPVGSLVNIMAWYCIYLCQTFTCPPKVWVEFKIQKGIWGACISGYPGRGAPPPIRPD